MNGIRGISPRLSAEQRRFVREIEQRKRELSKQIAALRDERRSLPTSASLATEYGCAVDTLRRAARGQEYAHDQVAV
jgi:hypothetical protein